MWDIFRFRFRQLRMKFPVNFMECLRTGFFRTPPVAVSEIKEVLHFQRFLLRLANYKKTERVALQ